MNTVEMWISGVSNKEKEVSISEFPMNLTSVNIFIL